MCKVPLSARNRKRHQTSPAGKGHLLDGAAGKAQGGVVQGSHWGRVVMSLSHPGSTLPRPSPGVSVAWGWLPSWEPRRHYEVSRLLPCRPEENGMPTLPAEVS